MPTDIKEIFRRVIDQLDEAERNDLLLELKDKKLSGKELADAIRELPEDEKAAVRDAFLSVAESSSPDAQTKKEAGKLEDEAEKDDEAETVIEKDEGKKKKSRPGRKNGRAYGWYVDEKGKVKVSDVATVYSGEDEPDEVELYPDDEDEEEIEEED
jgi:hypothetical protein